MTDKNPIGAFVRLPIPEVAARKIRTALDTPSYEPERLYAALLAIGTPINGNELACAGSVKWYANDPDPIVETYVPSAFEKGASVSIVSLSDAQALIAAHDAEIAQLKLEACHANDTADAAISEVARLKAHITVIDKLIMGNFDPIAMFCGIHANCTEALKGGAA